MNNMSNIIDSKICKSCMRKLPLDDFAPRKWRSNKPDAHFTYSTYGSCRECIAKRKLAWRKSRPDYMREYRLKLKQATV
jgi:hypothetical protein